MRKKIRTNIKLWKGMFLSSALFLYAIGFLIAKNNVQADNHLFFTHIFPIIISLAFCIIDRKYHIAFEFLETAKECKLIPLSLTATAIAGFLALNRNIPNVCMSVVAMVILCIAAHSSGSSSNVFFGGVAFYAIAFMLVAVFLGKNILLLLEIMLIATILMVTVFQIRKYYEEEELLFRFLSAMLLLVSVLSIFISLFGDSILYTAEDICLYSSHFVERFTLQNPKKCAFIVLLYIAILVSGFRLLQESESSYSRYLRIGCFSVLLSEILLCTIYPKYPPFLYADSFLTNIIYWVLTCYVAEVGFSKLSRKVKVLYLMHQLRKDRKSIELWQQILLEYKDDLSPDLYRKMVCEVRDTFEPLHLYIFFDGVDELFEEEQKKIASLPRDATGAVAFFDYMVENRDYYDGWTHLLLGEFSDYLTEEKRSEVMEFLKNTFSDELLSSILPCIFDNPYEEIDIECCFIDDMD